MSPTMTTGLRATQRRQVAVGQKIREAHLPDLLAMLADNDEGGPVHLLAAQERLGENFAQGGDRLGVSDLIIGSMKSAQNFKAVTLTVLQVEHIPRHGRAPSMRPLPEHKRACPRLLPSKTGRRMSDLDDTPLNTVSML